MMGLPYIHACVNGALRIYPPIPSTLQRDTCSTTVKISGYDIPPKVNIHIPLYYSTDSI
ncbi:hypothetical protein BGW36DRAFT_375574 [Talaromyces proteolyticus]|uniref:Uncharacterized protein n=1 Tax=Talaromyces proteolyticus TaxID=1131652 RepID=A0AAD4KW66_9EURO|nr:uncharacterized protein BGW36DRAFT_375574 [Talaromyces proteolyticus]KAH8701110.1 hypothetical protein BGW36DRAFT_375574 [Talaromyces proteolyticus]